MNDEMNDKIIEKAGELKRAILNSDEYRKYEACRNQLMKDEELFKKVQEFRNKNFEIQITGESAKNEVVDGILMKYSGILSNQTVSEYMNAELLLCKKLQKMYQVITEDIELDLDFL